VLPDTGDGSDCPGGAFGQRLLALVAESVQAGVDPDQALRDATRAWEQKVRVTGL